MIFFILERFIYSPFKFEKRGIHSFTNFSLFVISFFVFYFIASFEVNTIFKLNSLHLGILYKLKIPYYLKLIIGVVSFDFVSYWNHRLNHRFTFPWRFHRVHHSDTTMDSTTGFRFHPLDFFGPAGILLAVVVFGLDLYMLALYSFIVTIFVMAQHWNYVTPNWVDKTFGKIFTTPNFHKIHHSKDQYYTDSNFADILIIWDRIFGTFKYTDISKLYYGLEPFETPKHQSLWHLLKSPFLNLKSK